MKTDSLNRCPECGYTKEDALIHWDHHLCKGKIPDYDATEAVESIPAGVGNLIDCLSRGIWHEAQDTEFDTGFNLAKQKAMVAAGHWLAAQDEKQQRGEISVLTQLPIECKKAFDAYLVTYEQHMEILYQGDYGGVTNEEKSIAEEFWKSAWNQRDANSLIKSGDIPMNSRLHDILHILRNPHGKSEDEVRRARQEAADLIEWQSIKRKIVEEDNSLGWDVSGEGCKYP